jgi:hypothetical protein
LNTKSSLLPLAVSQLLHRHGRGQHGGFIPLKNTMSPNLAPVPPEEFTELPELYCFHCGQTIELPHIRLGGYGPTLNIHQDCVRSFLGQLAVDLRLIESSQRSDDL